MRELCGIKKLSSFTVPSHLKYKNKMAVEFNILSKPRRVHSASFPSAVSRQMYSLVFNPKSCARGENRTVGRRNVVGK